MNTPDSGAGGIIDLMTGGIGLLVVAIVILAGVFGLIMYLTLPKNRKK